MKTRMKIDIGIDARKREEIAGGLSRVLADSYTLYLKTHNFHWNVTGPHVPDLHPMFETQYKELALAVDLVAERIRALGVTAPGTYRQFIAMSAIKEDDGVPKADGHDRRLVGATRRSRAPPARSFRAAEAASDQPTCDLLTQRMQVHEKTAWMLRSLPRVAPTQLALDNPGLPSYLPIKHLWERKDRTVRWSRAPWTC